MSYPVLAQGSTWYKSSVLRSTYTQIDIVDSYTPTSSEDEVWNADIGNAGEIKCYRAGTVLTIAGNGSGKIAMNADSNHAFSVLNADASTGFSNITAINNAHLLDTSSVTSMNRMFKFTSALKVIDVSGWNTGSVTDMAGMFDRTGLETIALDDWDVSNVTDMSRMFQLCTKLTTLNLGKWNVSKVTTMLGMFLGHVDFGGGVPITTIGDVSGWDVSSVTDMNSMFQLCDKLTELDLSGWNISNVADISYMFMNCASLVKLNLSNWNFKRATNLSYFFMGCSALTELDASGWNVSNITDMGSMFNGCSSLAALDVSGWDVSRVTNMQFMFNKCFALRYLDVSKWDTSNVVNMGAMFQGSTYATDRLVIRLKGIESWNTSNVENMGWMFYSIRLLPQKGNDTAADYEGNYDYSAIYELDLSGWDVSKVKCFHHMFAHSANIYLKGIENWKIGAKVEPVEGDDKSYITMNCFLHRTVNDYYDLSNWDVSKVRDFRGMFRQCKNLVRVDGLDKWNTSNGKSFSVMFSHCVSMIELDVSGFDTRNASESYKDPYRGKDYESYTGVAMQGFFGLDSSEVGTNMQHVAKIKIGENFSFNGDGSATVPALLPTIDTAIFTDADGKWYDAAGAGYSVDGVPNLTAATYYATSNLAAEAGEERVSVKTGTLVGAANAIRESKYVGNFRPSEFANEIRTVTDKMAYYREKAEGKGTVMREFLQKNPNYFSSYTSATYTLANAVGAEFKDGFSVNVTSLCMSSKTFDYAAMKDYGCVVFRDVSGIYKDTVPTVADILTNDDAVVYAKDAVELGTLIGYNSYNCVLRPVWADEADVVHYILAYMVDMSGTVHVRDTVYYQSNGYDLSVRGMCEIFKSSGTAENQNLYKTAISFFDAYNAYFVS